MKTAKLYFKGKKYEFCSERDALNWLKLKKVSYFRNGALGRTYWNEASMCISGDWSEEGEKEFNIVTCGDKSYSGFNGSYCMIKRDDSFKWNRLLEKDPEEYRRQYIEFMYCKDNSHKCSRCPENSGYEVGRDQLPCGQYHCWVFAHCEREE
jgi:hypothetical protein